MIPSSGGNDMQVVVKFRPLLQFALHAPVAKDGVKLLHWRTRYPTYLCWGATRSNRAARAWGFLTVRFLKG
jgi:hypothetical protein